VRNVSPVSRGRKIKNKQRPAWFYFYQATKNVIEAAETLLPATGPRALEQATAELLGAELHRTLNEHHRGLWFAWWFDELVAAVVREIQNGRTPGGWESQ
jgi:hypothetical protein